MSVAGDIGKLLIFTVTDENGIVDLTNAATITLDRYYGIPIGKKLDTKTPTIYGAPTNGQVSYEYGSGDISEASNYKMRVNIVFLDGSTYTSSAVFDQVESL